MRAAILPCFLLTALWAVSVDAAQSQPPSESDAKASELPAVHERELLFEVSETPCTPDSFWSELTAVRQQPKLLELLRDLSLLSKDVRPQHHEPMVGKLLRQRYLAVFEISFEFPKESESVADGTGGVIRRVTDEQTTMFNGLSRRPSDWFQSLVDSTPKERLPAEDVQSVFTKDFDLRVGRAITQKSPVSRTVVYDPATVTHEKIRGKVLSVQFKVLAPSEERARELVGAMVSLFDYGYSTPAHGRYLSEKEVTETTIPQIRADLKQAQDELTRATKTLDELNEFADIGEAMLMDLAAQKRMIAVDMAGINARIGACQELLAKPGSVNRRERLETVKITAEVELVGLEARRAMIESLMDKGQQRVKVVTKANAAKTRLSWPERRLKEAESALAEYQTAIDQRMAFGKVSKVLIYPIRWDAEPVPRPAVPVGTRQE